MDGTRIGGDLPQLGLLTQLVKCTLIAEPGKSLKTLFDCPSRPFQARHQRVIT